MDSKAQLYASISTELMPCSTSPEGSGGRTYDGRRRWPKAASTLVTGVLKPATG